MTLALSTSSYLSLSSWMRYERFTAKQNSPWQEKIKYIVANRINDLVSLDLLSNKRSLISRVTPLAYAALLCKVYPVSPLCTSAVAIGSIALKMLVSCLEVSSKHVAGHRTQKNGQEGSQGRGQITGKKSKLTSWQTAVIELLIARCQGNKDVAGAILDFLTYKRIDPIQNCFLKKTLFFYKHHVTDKQIEKCSRYIGARSKEVDNIIFDDCDVGDITKWNNVAACTGEDAVWWELKFKNCDLSEINWEKIEKTDMSLEIHDCLPFSDFQWESLKKCQSLFGLKLKEADLSRVQWHNLPRGLWHLSVASCKIGAIHWKALKTSQLKILNLSNCFEVEKMQWKDIPKSVVQLDLSGWPLDQVEWEAVGELRLVMLVIERCDLRQVKWDYLGHLQILTLSQRYFPLFAGELLSLPGSLKEISDDKGNLRYTRSGQKETFTVV